MLSLEGGQATGMFNFITHKKNPTIGWQHLCHRCPLRFLAINCRAFTHLSQGIRWESLTQNGIAKSQVSLTQVSASKI